MAARDRDRDRDRDDDRSSRSRGRDRDDDRGGRDSGGKGKKFSYHPDDATSAGMINQGRWEVERSYYGLFAYGGKGTPSPALIWELIPADGEKGDKQVESWTLGGGRDAAKAWHIPKDGDSVEPRNGQTGFAKNAKITELFASIVAAGGEKLIDAESAA